MRTTDRARGAGRGKFLCHISAQVAACAFLSSLSSFSPQFGSLVVRMEGRFHNSVVWLPLRYATTKAAGAECRYKPAPDTEISSRKLAWI
jgi:hypothetical protein